MPCLKYVAFSLSHTLTLISDVAPIVKQDAAVLSSSLRVSLVGKDVLHAEAPLSWISRGL